MLYALTNNTEGKFSLSFFDNSRKNGKIAVWIACPSQEDWVSNHYNDEFFWVAQKNLATYEVTSSWRKIAREAFVFLNKDGSEFTPPSVDSLLDQFEMN